MSTIKISQGIAIRQTLSPNMIQSFNILQMNAQELSDYVSALALENPMVELDQRATSDPDELRVRKLEWLANLDEQNRAFYKYDRDDAENTGLMENVRSHRAETLADLLRLQLLSGHYRPREMEVFDYIIASLDDHGFFTLPASHLAKAFDMTVEDAQSYLKVMRGLEPAGVCTSGPVECLLTQIAKKEDPDWDVERDVVSRFMQKLAKNKLPAIAQELGLPLERVTKALKRIRELNPYPAQGFDTEEAMHYVTPDLTIVKFADRFEILLNEYSYPQIRINKYYLKLLRSDCDEETKSYLSGKLKQIEETREHIARRGSTLLALGQFLLSRQEDFFLKGESSLRPLLMKEAAASIGVHESTISRAVHDKYLQCTWGLYPLNYFFSTGVAAKDEETLSVRTVKASLRSLIDEEDRRHPRSDQKLCDLLQAQGIVVSRRTVAKYREEMGIGSTRERKVWA